MDDLRVPCPRCGSGSVLSEGGEPNFGSVSMVKLSKRQLTMLGLIQQGLTNDQIAERLFVSRNTVKFHLKQLYLRLGIRPARRRVGVQSLSPPSDRHDEGLHVLVIKSSAGPI